MPTDSPAGALATLEGRRLRLRPLAAEDAAAVFEAVEASREQLRRRLRWVSLAAGVEDESRFIARSEAESQSGAVLVWGVFEAKSGGFAGVVSLDRAEAAERAGIGCWIRADRQERGYASEAGKLVLEHCFRKLGVHRVYARIDPANRAFRKVLKKLGFRYEGCLRDDKRLNGRWIDQECWGILNAEWKR